MDMSKEERAQQERDVALQSHVEDKLAGVGIIIALVLGIIAGFAD